MNLIFQGPSNATNLTQICNDFGKDNGVIVTAYRSINTDSLDVMMYNGTHSIKSIIYHEGLINGPENLITTLLSMKKKLKEAENCQGGFYGGLMCSNPSANVKINRLDGGLNVIEYSGSRPEFIPYKPSYVSSIKQCAYCLTKDAFNKHLCTQCGAPEQ